MDYYFYTHQGLVRKNNEDSLLALPDKGVFAVADGLGGHSAGEVASREALAEIEKTSFSDKFPAEQEIVDAINRANESILLLSRKNKAYLGMGTTLSMLLLRNNVAEIGHVGDSRVYHFSDSQLERKTKDHTLAQEWLDQGKIEVEPEPEHRANHIVTRALGAKPDLEIDYFYFPVNDKDMIFLCTDGVNKHMSDAELQDLFSRNDMTPERMGEEINETVLNRGATDNFTYILLTV